MGWKVLSIEETFQELERSTMSLTRYGDGELKIVSDGRPRYINKGMEFVSKRLINKIRHIPALGGYLGNKTLCIGLTPAWDEKAMARMAPKTKEFWTDTKHPYASPGWERAFPSPATFCHTSLTRPDHFSDLSTEATHLFRTCCGFGRSCIF